MNVAPAFELYLCGKTKMARLVLARDAGLCTSSCAQLHPYVSAEGLESLQCTQARLLVLLLLLTAPLA